MSRLKSVTPLLSVHLYKTISRKTIDGQAAVSARYEGKDEFIDLTASLGEGSAVRTSKSVREPAGAFSITFADKPHGSGSGVGVSSLFMSLESVYGLVEPMDMVEIRMWGGEGRRPLKLPIIMRGFVSDVTRSQTMGPNGKPQRQVVVTGHDYGKIWQTFQVLYLAAYAEGKSLLTNFGLNELFGVGVVNAMASGEFIRQMVTKIINPHIKGFMPKYTSMPTEIQTGESIAVKHGMVNNSFQNMQGSLYDIMKFHGDVGVWNELYTEDREDGVHAVYRPVPALFLTKPDGAKSRIIQDDAVEPIFVYIPDDDIQSLSVARTDQNVANFFWVNNSRFDLIDDMQRKLASIPGDSGKVSTKDYPNSDPKYYGLRPMYAETQQGGDAVNNMNSGLSEQEQSKRSTEQEAWIDNRRRLMMEMNRDNVVYERGSARIKGGPMRPVSSGTEPESMKAGDYAIFRMGQLDVEAYVVQLDHEFLPFASYTTSLVIERGTGFAARSSMSGGVSSPWLAEQASRLSFSASAPITTYDDRSNEVLA